MLMVFGCDWLRCQGASEFAAYAVEGGCAAMPGGAKTREVVVKLTEHRLRRGFAFAQNGKPAGLRGGCEDLAHGESGDARLFDKRHHFCLVKEDDPAVHFVAVDQTGVGPSEKRFRMDAKVGCERTGF
jgi:hypothetical protein